MAIITNVQYAAEDLSQLRIFYGDLTEIMGPNSAVTGYRYRYTDDVTEWLELGFTIEPFYPYYGISLERAYITKGNEIGVYSADLIEGAYANPVQGDVENPKVYRTQLNRRRANNADKLAGELSLGQPDKDQAKTDQKLSEYEVKISNDENKALSNMHKLDTVDEVMMFDVPAQNWNIWTPPV